MKKQFKIFEGQKLGKLTIIKDTGERKWGKIVWLCRCECGNMVKQTSIILARSTFHSCSQGCWKKISEGESNFNTLFRIYENIAKRKKMDFLLTKKQFKKLTQENCYYCGKEPAQIIKGKNSNGEYKYNGIDRIDNMLGYIFNNCVSCCKLCNMMKKDLIQKEFYEHIKKIYNYSYAILTKGVRNG